MSAKDILLLPGDGIGPEIIAQTEKVLRCLRDDHGLELRWKHALIGGAAYEEAGVPLPEETLRQALAADGVLLGAVGGPQWETLERDLRPERGLLAIRSRMELFANLRPITVHDALADASSLKPEHVAGLDLMIVRELTGGIYFGTPRGIETLADGRRGYNTLSYHESEIERIARVAFRLAQQRAGRLCSVDKANVLEATELWRMKVEELAPEYPDVELRHMYVDNAAMQLVRNPRQFDVILTTNMFGDILSDLASMLTGSIGMLPSASVGVNRQGLYEPIHGSAPDIAGTGTCNPLAAILSLAMLLRHSLEEPDWAGKVEQAVKNTLDNGHRTHDLAAAGDAPINAEQMGDAVVEELRA